MRRLAGTVDRQSSDRVLVGAILVAIIGSIAVVLVTYVVPGMLIGAGALGVIAIAGVRAAPMVSLIGLTFIRASLEGLGSGQLFRIGGVGLALPDILSLAFLVGALWWLVHEATHGNSFWKDPIAWPAAAVVLVAFASLAYSPTPVLGARDLLKWASALCAYLVIVARKPSMPQLKHLLYAVVAGAVIPLLYGWWQLANGIGKPNLLHGGLRIQSTFNHPNTYGFYAVTVIVAAWGLRSQVSGTARRFVSLVGAAAFAASLFTLSRTAWGALGLVLLILCWRDRRLAAMASIVGVAILAAAPRLISRVLDLFQPREGGNKGNSLLGRLNIWSGEIQTFLEKPLFGHGFGYTLSSQEKASHNDFLRMLVETGVIGFLALVVLVITLIRFSVKVARGRADLPLGFLGLSLAYAVQSLASNNMGKGAYQLYFWVLAGASVIWASYPVPSGKISAPKGKPAGPKPAGPKITAICCAVLAVLPAVPALAQTPDLGKTGLYQHVVAGELDSATARKSLPSNHELITVRGAGGSTEAVRALIDSDHNARVFLYRMGTAVSETIGEQLAGEHPDWVTRDASGEVVLSRPGNYVLDITNPEVRTWLVEAIETSVDEVGYDGVYLDVLGSFFSERFYSARPVMGGAPLTDAAWRDASIALINEVRSATGKPVVINGFGLQSGKNYQDHKRDSDMLIEVSDGVQIEHFTRTGSMDLAQSKNAMAWHQDVEFLASVSSQNKLVLVNTRVKEFSSGPGRERTSDFALASFLVGAEGPALFQFGGQGAGDQAADMKGTVTALGAAVGPAEQLGGAMIRRFAGGTVAANPTRSPVAFEFDGETVMLPPGQGWFRLISEGRVAAESGDSPAGDRVTGTADEGGLRGFGIAGAVLAILVAIVLMSVFGMRARRSRNSE